MHVLVTGGMGNLGRATMRELLRRGCGVRCLDLPTPRNRRRARALPRAVEVRWGDIRTAADVEAAVRDCDVVVHLAGIIPPLANERPNLAEAANVGGSRNVFSAAARQGRPPRVLLASSLDVFGPTGHLRPPRVVTDPLVPTDNYSRHKIQSEGELRASGLPWAIYRFAVMPVLGPNPPHPVMFDIPLETRMELLHVEDAALAVAAGVTGGGIWNRIWLIGGGPSCQVTYERYLRAMLAAVGLPMLPQQAFGARPYCTDWLDTRASQELLRFQRHSFEELVAEVARHAGVARLLAPVVAPLVMRRLLAMSPHHRASVGRG